MSRCIPAGARLIAFGVVALGGCSGEQPGDRNSAGVEATDANTSAKANQQPGTSADAGRPNDDEDDPSALDAAAGDDSSTLSDAHDARGNTCAESASLGSTVRAEQRGSWIFFDDWSRFSGVSPERLTNDYLEEVWDAQTHRHGISGADEGTVDVVDDPVAGSCRGKVMRARHWTGEAINGAPWPTPGYPNVPEHRNGDPYWTNTGGGFNWWGGFEGKSYDELYLAYDIMIPSTNIDGTPMIWPTGSKRPGLAGGRYPGTDGIEGFSARFMLYGPDTRPVGTLDGDDHTPHASSISGVIAAVAGMRRLSPVVPLGDGGLRWSASAKTLEWKAHGESYGPPHVVDGSRGESNFRLFSAGGSWLGVHVVRDELPSSDATDDVVPVLNKGNGFNPAGLKLDAYLHRYKERPDDRGTTNIKSEEQDGTQYIVPFDEWVTIEQRIRMNSIDVEGESGKRDGIVQVWITDSTHRAQLVADRRNVVFRITASNKIEYISMHDMLGGPNSYRWASWSDHFCYYDNFIVSTKPITH